MNTFRFCRAVALSLFAFACSAGAQAQIISASFEHYTPQDDFPFRMAFQPATGGTLMTGATKNTSGINMGIVMEEEHTINGNLTFVRAFQPTSGFDYVANAVDVNPVDNTIAVAGYERVNANGFTAIHFQHLNSAGIVLHDKVFQSPTYSATSTCVKALYDGSFIIGGVAQSGNNRYSFLARIGAAPSYNVVWTRIIGKLAPGPGAQDAAIAIEQLDANRIAVAGNTSNFASSFNFSEPYIFTVTLDQGLIPEFFTYKVTGLSGMSITDMAKLPGGNYALVGNAITSAGERNAFLLTVGNDLSAGTYREVLQSNATKVEQIFGVAAQSANNEFMMVGAIENVNPSNPANARDGFLVRFGSTGTIIETKSVPSQQDNELRDVIVLGNGQYHAFGFRTRLSTEAQPGKAYYSLLIPPNPVFCDHSQIVTTSVTRTITRTSRVADGGTVFPFSTSGLPTVNVTFTSNFKCRVLPRMAAAEYSLSEEELLATSLVDEPVNLQASLLFPNPAQGEVTLRIPAADSPAFLLLTDAAGHVLRRLDDLAAETAIDLSGLSAGVYFVNVFQGTEQKTHRLLVQ